MKYRVIVLPGAKSEFIEIHRYLKNRFGKSSASRFKIAYGKLLKTLKQTPRIYGAIPEREGVRKCAALAPTIVLYEVFEQEKRVEILTLYDGRVDQE